MMADTPVLECAYLILGTDELKRKVALKRLRARLDPAYSIFNLEEIEGPTVEVSALLTSLDTLPVGDTQRIIIVHAADRLPKVATEAICSYLTNPSPSSVLVLCADKLARNTRLYKAVAKVGRRTIVDCAPKKRWELPQQLVRMAQAHGATLDMDAAQELVARVGESTTLLDAQLSSLAEFCIETRHITLADVERHVVRTAEVRPWDLLDALCQRDASKALALYGQMHNPSPIALVAMLSGRMRELICAKCLTARGCPDQLAAELGKQAWQVRHHVGWAHGFAAGELERILAECASTDAALKSGADGDIALTRLMLDVCGAVHHEGFRRSQSLPEAPGPCARRTRGRCA